MPALRAHREEIVKKGEEPPGDIHSHNHGEEDSASPKELSRHPARQDRVQRLQEQPANHFCLEKIPTLAVLA